VALDEGRRPEVLDTGAGRRKALSATYSASVRVHDEGVTRPKIIVVGRAVRDLCRLTVYRHHHRGHFTHRTLGNIVFDLLALDIVHHHRQWVLSG